MFNLFKNKFLRKKKITKDIKIVMVKNVVRSNNSIVRYGSYEKNINLECIYEIF